MTVSEKIAMMETLWDEITRDQQAIESPGWHKDILDDRRTRVASGQSKFADWDLAKANLRKKVE